MKTFTEEHKKNISTSLLGHAVSDHHREAAKKVMTEMNKRKYQDPDYKKQQLEKMRLGRNHNKKVVETIYIDENGNEHIIKDQDINGN